jgi:hypothetical protein
MFIDIDDNKSILIIIVVIIICLIFLFIFIFIYKSKSNVKHTGSGIYYGSYIDGNNGNGNGNGNGNENGNNRIVNEFDDEGEFDEFDEGEGNVFRNDRASIYYDNYGNEHTLLPNQTILVNGAPVRAERGGDGYFYSWNGHNYIIHFPSDSLFMDNQEQIVNNPNNRMPVAEADI